MSRGARVILLIAIGLIVIWLLFTVVFPWVDRTFVSDPVLGQVLTTGPRWSASTHL